MVKTLIFAAALTASTFLFSCNRELETTRDSGLEGEVSFGLSVSTKSNGGEDVSEGDNAIDKSSFAVKIENLSGTVLKEWSRFDEVPTTLKFGVGAFAMRASSGDSTAQGFEKPSYSGSTKFTIAHNETTNINVVCKNNKTLVSVEPSRGFYDYYKDFYTEVSSSNGDAMALTYLKGETRIGYFVPGNIYAKVYITRSNGSQLTADMPILPSRANDHYKIKVSIGKGAGSVAFTVVVEETNEVVSEVTIPLTAISGLPPHFGSKDFDVANPRIEVIESAGKNAHFLIKTGAPIKSCIVQTTSNYLISKGIPATFDLASIDSDLSNKLKAMGLKWTEKLAGAPMAEVDFTDFSKNIPAKAASTYDHSITLTVSDIYDRKGSLPIVFAVQAPLFEIEKIDAVTPTDGNTKLEIKLTAQITNGTIDQLTGVYYQLPAGYVKAANLKKEIDPTTKKLVATISGIEKNSQTSFPIKLEYKTPLVVRESNVMVAYVSAPKFVLGDVVVNGESQAVVKVVASQLENLETAFDESLLKLYLKNQGSWTELATESSYDDATKTKTFTISGLTPGEQSRVKAMYDNKYNSFNDKLFKANNFSFEYAWTQIFSTNMNKGGGYGYTAGIQSISMKQEKETVTRLDLPTGSGWSDTNATTAVSSSNPLNSWFVVPSALPENAGQTGKGVFIRSVAYSTGGINVESKYGKWLWNATSLTDLPIPKFTTANYAAGKITTSRVLRSRPLGFGGYYKFAQLGSDKASVTVTIYGLDDAGNEQPIGTGKALFETSVANWTPFSLAINYSQSYKATRAVISCASSDDPTKIEISFDGSSCKGLGNRLYLDEFNFKY